MSITDEEKILLNENKLKFDDLKLQREAEKLKLESEKIQLEKEKIALETRNLKQPFRQPTLWVAVIGTIISIGFFGVKERIAALELANAKTELTNTEEQKKTNKKSADSIKIVGVQLNKKNDLLNKKYEKLNEQTQNTQSNLDNLRRNAGNTKTDILDLIKSTKSKVSAESEIILQQVVERLSRLEKLSNNAAEEFKYPISKAVQTSRTDLAQSAAREGFQYLIDRRLSQAVEAFNRSEKTYPGYRVSYELSRLITAQLKKGPTASDNEEFIKQIATKYAEFIPKGFPKDLKRR